MIWFLVLGKELPRKWPKGPVGVNTGPHEQADAWDAGKKLTKRPGKPSEGFEKWTCCTRKKFTTGSGGQPVVVSGCSRNGSVSKGPKPQQNFDKFGTETWEAFQICVKVCKNHLAVIAFMSVGPKWRGRISARHVPPGRTA